MTKHCWHERAELWSGSKTADAFSAVQPADNCALVGRSDASDAGGANHGTFALQTMDSSSHVPTWTPACLGAENDCRKVQRSRKSYCLAGKM